MTVAVTVLLTVLATLVAGGAGAVIRASAVARSVRAGTAVVNVVGTALLAAVLVAHGRGAIGTATAVVLGVGFSGSLTTFSGWIALVADGLRERPSRTLLVDVLLPLLASVALTVAAFALAG
jgi:fluoride ion exporter CrcB/FEX